MPTTMLKYFKTVADLLISLVACVVNRPTIRNGIPRPSAYEMSKTKPSAGLVTASAKTLPSIALTQCVQPTAKAAPKPNEVT